MSTARNVESMLLRMRVDDVNSAFAITPIAHARAVLVVNAFEEWLIVFRHVDDFLARALLIGHTVLCEVVRAALQDSVEGVKTAGSWHVLCPVETLMPLADKVGLVAYSSKYR